MQLQRQQDLYEQRLRDQEKRHDETLQRMQDRLDNALQSFRDQQQQQEGLLRAVGGVPDKLKRPTSWRKRTDK